MRTTSMKAFTAALAALALCACPGPSNNNPPDSGADANDIDPTDILIAVSGTAQHHPDAVKYYTANGLTLPSIAGLTLRVEEPLKAALQDPTGYFGTVTLTDAGTFRVENVSSNKVTLGIAAGIFEDPDGGVADGGTPRVIRSATSLYDVALEGRKPTKDVAGGKAYAIPTAFHDKLTSAVGTAKIKGISGFDTLLASGFLLGRVVDSAGAPVAGVKIVATKYQSQFVYPSDDLSTTQAATGASGLFIYIHNGLGVDPFNITVEGKPEYIKRNAGSAKDACLVMTVYPGTTPPP
jgi:hypothetical protein